MALKIKGNKAVLKRLGDLKKEGRELVQGRIERTLSDIRNDAMSNAPVNDGFLKNSIIVAKNDQGIGGKVIVNAEYAPFMEFGTGTKVDVPVDISSYAAEFKNKKTGSFEEFKESLKRWMKQKGINEKYFYPIMIKIMRVGIAPKPFLFPAWFNHSKQLMPKIEKGLNQITKG